MTLWWYFRSFTFKSRCQIEPLVTIPTHESCLLFDLKLLFSTTLWCWFMSWTFKSRCHNANTRILFALWFKITFQYDIVVILQVLHFQVQMLNWTSCYNPNIQILFALWIKISLQYDIEVILQVLQFQVHMLNWTSCYNPNTRILFALVVYMISSITPFLQYKA